MLIEGAPPTAVDFAALGDLHGPSDYLDAAVAAIAARAATLTGVLLVGDIGPDVRGPGRRYNADDQQRHAAAVRDTLARFDSLNLPLCWVPGNHDPADLRLPGNVDRLAQPLMLGGVRIAGIGGAGPARFGFPYEWDEDEIRRRRVPACDLLIAHAPPAETPLDVLAGRGTHAGSYAIRERAEAHHGLLLCGHIHEAAGAVQLNECLAVNLGALGRPYPQPRVGWVRREADGRFRVALEHLETGEMQQWCSPPRA